MTQAVGDLVVLVPDKNMEFAVRGLLSRPQSLSIRQIRCEVHTHIERDPGCLKRGHDFLRPMVSRYTHGLVMFDRAGCGRESLPRQQLEEAVENRLSGSGWGDRAAAIALDPELEVWVWSDSPQVAACLGWEADGRDLRAWLVEQGLWPQDAIKPSDPKAAMERALGEVRKQRSSATYGCLARAVSFRRCTDPAFQKLTSILAQWFPDPGAA